MRISIVLAPDLAINSVDFVDAWNTNEQTGPLATASASTQGALVVPA